MDASIPTRWGWPACSLHTNSQTNAGTESVLFVSTIRSTTREHVSCKFRGVAGSFWLSARADICDCHSGGTRTSSAGTGKATIFLQQPPQICIKKPFHCDYCIASGPLPRSSLQIDSKTVPSRLIQRLLIRRLPPPDRRDGRRQTTWQSQGKAGVLPVFYPLAEYSLFRRKCSK